MDVSEVDPEISSSVERMALKGLSKKAISQATGVPINALKAIFRELESLRCVRQESRHNKDNYQSDLQASKAFSHWPPVQSLTVHLDDASGHYCHEYADGEGKTKKVRLDLRRLDSPKGKGPGEWEQAGCIVERGNTEGDGRDVHQRSPTGKRWSDLRKDDPANEDERNELQPMKSLVASQVRTGLYQEMTRSLPIDRMTQQQLIGEKQRIKEQVESAFCGQ